MRAGGIHRAALGCARRRRHRPAAPASGIYGLVKKVGAGSRGGAAPHARDRRRARQFVPKEAPCATPARPAPTCAVFS
ncbi:MAG: hypothetical protein M0C28_37290 [Candidatus Moduliflexus flocculans]|nr:hypothetical protein [Candidatus Moduliflexus flocculans]